MTTIQDAGPGDYILTVQGNWERITSHDCPREGPLPRNWTVRTEEGSVLDMWGVRRYAKAEEIDENQDH